MRRLPSTTALLAMVALAACGGNAAPAIQSPGAASASADSKQAASAAPPSTEAKPPASTAADEAQSKPAAGVSFQGKTIALVCGFAAGGPNDIFDRLLARYLPKHMPGSPTVIVQNQTGAGGILATNNVFNSAKPDGLTLLANTDPMTPWLLKDPAVKYELGKFVWVGGVSEGAIQYVSAKTSVKTVADLKSPKAPIVFGGLSLASSKDLLVRVYLKLAGVDFKYVTGYSGAATYNQALQSGEISMADASLTDYNTGVLPLIENNLVTAISQTGIVDNNGQIVPDKRSNLPTVLDAIKEITGKMPSGPEYDALVFLVSTHNALRSLVLPPGTPSDVAATWRMALADSFADPGLKADAQKQFGIELQYLSGADTQKIIGNSAAMAEQRPEGPKVLQTMAEIKPGS